MSGGPRLQGPRLSNVMTVMRKWIGAVEDVFMFGKWIALAAGLVGGTLFVLNGGLSSHSSTPGTTLLSDPTPVIAQSSEAMRTLKSMKLSMGGTMVVGGDSLQITGSGSLSYPHEENLSYQLKIQSKIAGLPDAVAAVDERIEKGHVYIRYPDKSQDWKDVTSTNKGSLGTGMDPLANLDVSRAFRAADDQGDIVMDGVYVHHFSLNVDGAKYVAQLKADPENVLTADEQAQLSTAGIQVQVWIAAKDHYVHQLQISMVTGSVRWDVTYRYSDFVAGGGPTTV
jgi:hypothetical protein